MTGSRPLRAPLAHTRAPGHRQMLIKMIAHAPSVATLTSRLDPHTDLSGTSPETVWSPRRSKHRRGISALRTERCNISRHGHSKSQSRQCCKSGLVFGCRWVVARHGAQEPGSVGSVHCIGESIADRSPSAGNRSNCSPPFDTFRQLDPRPIQHWDAGQLAERRGTGIGSGKRTANQYAVDDDHQTPLPRTQRTQPRTMNLRGALESMRMFGKWKSCFLISEAARR